MTFINLRFKNLDIFAVQCDMRENRNGYEHYSTVPVQYDEKRSGIFYLGKGAGAVE